MVVADQNLIHRIIDAVGLARVAAQQMRRDLFDPGARAPRVGGDIGAAKRRAFAPAFGAVIRHHPDNGCVEAPVFPPTGQKIDPARIGQMDVVKFDPGNLHAASPFGGMRTSFPTCALDRKSSCAATIWSSG